MQFTMVIEVKDGTLTHSVKVVDGSTVYGLTLAQAAHAVAGHFLGHAMERILTESEVAPPPVVLPDGWEPTLDGVSSEVNVGSTSVTYTRTFQRGADIVTAPCSANGDPLPETVAVLTAAAPLEA